MVPTSHLSTISFYFTSRSTDVWVSTRLVSSILLAISALCFHRNQVLEPTALLSLLSYREPSAGTHGVIVFALVPRSRAPCAQQRALPVLSGVRSNANVTPRPSKYGIVQYDKSITVRVCSNANVKTRTSKYGIVQYDKNITVRCGQ